MAEAAGLDLRRIFLIAGVLLVVVFSVLFFLFRGCAPAVTQKPGYTVIYSNLDLKDAANVIARLKELAIPYEIRDEGRAIAVAKEKSDQARIGLAEKSLPLGGAVGWEIFDQARLGATDFDRRIQLIRAISGELSRTIRRIEGVEDARVQVVIPETKLFAATVAPVTASVLLRLQPGFELAPAKINGIVHLVASSVENLQPENVTVIDESGKILTVKVVAPELKLAPVPPPAEVAVTVISPEVAVSSPEVILKKEVPTAGISTIEVKAALVTGVPSLTAEERIVLKAQAKKEMEQDLSGKAQELLNRFYPPNSVIVRVIVDIKPAKEIEISAKDLKIKKLNAIVLVDNRLDLTPKLKQATFTTVAAAIGYSKVRGDRITLEKVPFHLATPPPEKPKVVEEKVEKVWVPPIPLTTLFGLGGIALAVLILIWLAGLIRRSRGIEPTELMEEEPAARVPPLAREKVSNLNQVKTIAERNPEQIAELLKKWLSE